MGATFHRKVRGHNLTCIPRGYLGNGSPRFISLSQVSIYIEETVGQFYIWNAKINLITSCVQLGFHRLDYKTQIGG